MVYEYTFLKSYQMPMFRIPYDAKIVTTIINISGSFLHEAYEQITVVL